MVATSFARIYYRNLINQGLPPVECPDAVSYISDKQELCISLQEGKVWTGGKTFYFNPLPTLVLDILTAGGLLSYTKKRISS